MPSRKTPHGAWRRSRQPAANRAIEARNGTVLGEILSATPDNRKALNALYLRVLAREPNAKEVKVCGNYLNNVGDRREAFGALRAAGIGANVHYSPVYLHSYYRARGFQPGYCPVAEAVYPQMLTLPLFPAMTQADVARVVRALAALKR